MKKENNICYIPFSNGKVDTENKVYYQTNENLTSKMYQNTNFENKQVLSVMGSGDHVLTSNYNFAKRTDAFDKSLLSSYYYQLRRWYIKYADLLYPDINSRGNFKRLIESINPKNDLEFEALIFFKKLLKYNVDLESMFYDIYEQPDGKVPYNSTKYLKQYMNRKVRFYLMDLFEKNNVNKNKYDIMLISNILDWARNDEKKLLMAKENIEGLLNQDGIVLCNNMVYRDMTLEREIFGDNFECEDYGMFEGYVYKRTK